MGTATLRDGPPATVPAPAAAGLPDWRRIHPASQAPQAFGDDSEFVVTTPTVLRGLFVDLADPAGNGTPLADLLRRRRDPSAPLEVHADVLRIGGQIALPLRSLLVHARRIELEAGAVLRLDEAADAKHGPASLDIYAEQVVPAQPGGHADIVFLGLQQRLGAADAPGHLHAIRQRDAAGGISLLAPRPVHELVPGDPLLALQQLYAARRLQFTAPTALLRDPHRLALDMALWVHASQALAGGNPGLAAEGRALAELLGNPRRDVHAVPALNWKSYHALALHMADTLVQAETQAQLYFARGEWHHAQTDVADDLLAHADAAKLLTGQLCEQAASELAAANDALATARARLADQHTENDQLCAAFRQGIERKRSWAEVEASVEGLGALAVLGAGIAGACMGNPEGAVDVVQKVGRMRRMFDMINLVGGLLEKIYKMYEMVSKTIDKLGRTGDYLAWGTKDLRAQSPSAAQWEAFRVDMEAAFDEPKRLEIDGATDYLAGLQKMAVFGREVVDCGLHVLRCDAVHQQRLWEKARNDADHDVVEARLRRLGDGPPDVHVRRYFEQMQDQLRLGLLQTLEKLDDAYRYDVLREPGQTASIELPAVRLRDLVVQSEAALVAGLEAFHAAPSSWTPRAWRLKSLPPAQAQAALHRLRTQRRVTWTCDPAMVADADRVRVAAIHVWLVGAGVPEQEIRIDITTSGCYRDRFAGQILRFVAPPLERTFAYVPCEGGRTRDFLGRPVDVTIWANDTQGVYTEPTAFATWELQVADGPSLDGLTDVAIEFVGSCMRAQPAHAQQDVPAPARAAAAPAVQ